jgi:hypothetical protein
MMPALPMNGDRAPTEPTIGNSFVVNVSDPGADMNRTSWPHGGNGPAVPHGVVFSRIQTP